MLKIGEDYILEMPVIIQLKTIFHLL